MRLDFTRINMSAAASQQTTKNEITLRGSVEIVTEFFGCKCNDHIVLIVWSRKRDLGHHTAAS